MKSWPPIGYTTDRDGSIVKGSVYDGELCCYVCGAREYEPHHDSCFDDDETVGTIETKGEK